jgi:predicted N-acetyltransferase YhbS
MTAIRPMTADDIPQVERLIETETAARRKDTSEAGLEPRGGRVVKSRFHKEPAGCFVGEDPTHGMIGAVLSITWGSIAWLGPLAVHPEFWGKGLEQQLLRAVLDYWEPMTLSAQGVEANPASPAQIEL